MWTINFILYWWFQMGSPYYQQAVDSGYWQMWACRGCTQEQIQAGPPCSVVDGKWICKEN